jgi:DNA-binding NtrC family response regulator/tetratricopeptide (TPR) repeat protein
VVFFLMGQPALALAAWEGLSGTGLEQGRLWVYRSRALERLQDFAGARAALARARGHRLAPEDEALAALSEGQMLWVEGRADEAAERLEPLARGSSDGDVRAQALCHLATQALHANRIEGAMRLLEEARYALPEPPQPLSEFLLLHRTGMALHKVGDFDKALAHFGSAREVAASVGFRCLEAWAGCDAGNALRQLYRFEEAIAAYRHAEEGATGLGLARLAESARFDLAVCQAEVGELGPAERAFLAALERGAGDAPRDRATGWYWLGAVRHQRGDYPGALEAAEEGIAALGDLKDPEVRFPLLVLRGEILLATGQLRKLGYLLRGMEGELGEVTEPNDRLAAAALSRAAAAKGEGRFETGDLKRAESQLGSASPYFKAYWYLLSAQALGDKGGGALDMALRHAREARNAHLACRAMLALSERGALPVLEPEERRWLARFLSENRVRGPERSLLAYLGEAPPALDEGPGDFSEDLILLSRAEAAHEETLDDILRRVGATCGCKLAPGFAPQWWGSGTAEQRLALSAAAGLKGEAPAPGGVMLGYPGRAGLWCGLFRPGGASFSPGDATVFRLWARLLRPAAEACPACAEGAHHPAVVRLILTRSPAMDDLLGRVERAAPFAFPVLITGEAGSGKEVCARAIHEASPRAGKPWIPANCANLTPTLAASLLFGHRRGAFTGADRDHAGFVETARGGTLFLDEVGEVPPEVQPGLLRYLQDGSYTPLGETRERRSDARVVAATNRDLEKAVAEGRFREDLFHRLKVIPIEVPPLRQRPEDIPLLFGQFLARAAKEEGVPEPAVEPAVLTRLAAYPWPGNVRELQNLARALLVEVDRGCLIREAHLPERLVNGAARPGRSLAAQMEAVERKAIASALKEAAGNRAAAARLLGISRQALAQKMKRLGMDGSP